MPDIKLTVVPSPIPEGMSVIVPDKGVTPAFAGTGSNRYLCGFCSAILIKGVPGNNVKMTGDGPGRMLMKCPQCSHHVKFPSEWAD